MRINLKFKVICLVTLMILIGCLSFGELHSLFSVSAEDATNKTEQTSSSGSRVLTNDSASTTSEISSTPTPSVTANSQSKAENTTSVHSVTGTSIKTLNLNDGSGTNYANAQVFLQDDQGTIIVSGKTDSAEQ